MDYPIRDDNHILESISKVALQQSIPRGWVLNEFRIDYGTDYNCEIVKENKVIGTNFSIQLKSKNVEPNREFVIVTGIKKTSINRWLKKLEPTMIVVYIDDEKGLYWQWVENNTFDLTNNNANYQIKIPRTNSFSSLNWNDIYEYVEKIFEKKHLLYKSPSEIEMNADVWKLYFNKDFEKALILFKQIIKSDENNILVLNAIAVCEYMLYHYKEALISINKAIDLVDDPKLLSTKASILTELGNEAQDDKLLSIAKDLFNEILVHERDAIILYNYGNCLNSLKQYKEAKIAYEESLSFDPNNEKVWNSLGNVYNELKVPQLGLQCFDKALTINPDLVHAIFNKGHTIFKYFGNAELGLNIMLESFKLDTNKTFELEFRYAYFWVAEAYLHLGDIINAIKMNNNGLRIHPTDSFFHLQKERIKNASSISS